MGLRVSPLGHRLQGSEMVLCCSDTALAMEEQVQPGPSRSEQPASLWRAAPEPDWLETGLPLTFIGHQVSRVDPFSVGQSSLGRLMGRDRSKQSVCDLVFQFNCYPSSRVDL